MIESLKSGQWLTPERLRVYPLLLLSFFGLAVFFLTITAHGNFDRFGRPLGPDFSEIWAAGQDVRDGQPINAYNPSAHISKQAELFGKTEDFYLWSYPPYFLAVAALLAFLPYLLALFIWQASTLLFYLFAIWRIAKPTGIPWTRVLILALAFPAAFVNLAHGQNGFLSAALLAGGLLNLKTRPILAGILFACLAYKPQFTVMIPIALIAGKHWRAILSGSITLGLMTVGTLAAFGEDVWLKFPQGLKIAKSLVLEHGGAGFEKMQSLFAAARILGASIHQAYVLQAAGVILLAVGIAWLWHSTADIRLKSAALVAGSLIATPYSFDYDMTLLGPALAFAISYGMEKGFHPYEKTLFACVWLCPLIARPLATATSIPTGALVMALFFATLLWRAYRDTALTAPRPTSLPLPQAT